MTPHLPTHEIQVGAIIGIRVWYVRDGYLHSSVGNNREWVPGLRQVARREQSRGAIGCFYCPGKSAPCTLDFSGDNFQYGDLRCGLHATPNMEYFPKHIPPYCTSGDIHMGERVVFGPVRLSGRVVEGACGWRAEFAEVHALCDGVPTPRFARCDDDTLANMALRYEVPILYLEELSLQATQIG